MKLITRAFNRNGLYVEVLKGNSRSWYFRIKGRNHKIIATSETYSSKAKALQSAELFAFPLVID